jgi:phytoene dehydrogenase-like protein
VIGAGPGGLTAARWLLSMGFEPTIFERSPVLGGASGRACAAEGMATGGWCGTAAPGKG